MNVYRTTKVSARMRPGMAKDQLVFAVICSAAIAVAALALVYHLKTGKIKATGWQCLDCSREFALKTTEMPPVKCPKCGGQAVRTNHRACPKCGKENLVTRVRLTEQGQARRQEIKDDDSRQSDASPGFGPVAKMMMLPTEIQYQQEQPGGKHGWTSWMPAGSPEAMQSERSLLCSDCGARLTLGKN